MSVLLLLFLSTVPLRSQSPLENAWCAQALLGRSVWSRVLRIENESRTGPYPRVVHALVFELLGVLWFYTDANGTQSFSLHRGQLDREKADFGPLLLDIDPGFRRWTLVAGAPPTYRDGGRSLHNGCFILSVVLWRERRDRGGPLRTPRLLSYYWGTPTGRLGHTVLAFECAGQIEVVDPVRPDVRRCFPTEIGSNPLALACAVAEGEVLTARTLPLEAADDGPPLVVGAVGPSRKRNPVSLL